LWDAFWNKLQPQQRFNDETSDVHVGFRSFFWNGAQVVVDQYLPVLAGNFTIYGLNTSYIFPLRLGYPEVPVRLYGMEGSAEHG